KRRSVYRLFRTRLRGIVARQLSKVFAKERRLEYADEGLHARVLRSACRKTEVIGLVADAEESEPSFFGGKPDTHARVRPAGMDGIGDSAMTFGDMPGRSTTCHDLVKTASRSRTRLSSDPA